MLLCEWSGLAGLWDIHPVGYMHKLCGPSFVLGCWIISVELSRQGEYMSWETPSLPGKERMAAIAFCYFGFRKRTKSLQYYQEYAFIILTILRSYLISDHLLNVCEISLDFNILKYLFPSFVYILKLLCLIKFWISDYLDFSLGTQNFQIKKQNKVHSQKKRDTENFCIKCAC